MPHARPAALVAALALTAVVVAGCAAPAPPRPPAAIVATSLAQSCGTAEAGSVPAGFEPVALYRCEEFVTYEDAEGTWQATALTVYEGDLSPVVTALAEPGEARSDGACPAIGFVVPALWLADARGRAVRASYPTRSCGEPITDRVDAAIAGLAVVREERVRATLLESRAAKAVHCPASLAPRLILAPDAVGEGYGYPGLTANGRPAPENAADAVAVEPVPAEPPTIDRAGIGGFRVCRYDVDPLSRTSASVPVTGRFADAGDVDRATALRILDLPRDADAAPPCGTVATRGVVLVPRYATGSTGIARIEGELDGCRRIFAPETSIRSESERGTTLPDDLVALLSGAQL